MFSTNEGLVTMESWTSQHRAFVVETFFKHGDSVTVTQRKFRSHFHISPRGKVPTRNTILQWIQNFRETGSALKKKPGGSARSVRTPGNVEAVRHAILNSPRRSAKQHSQALGLSNTSVRRILHDLNFHPYKIVTVQMLKPQDIMRRILFANKMREMLDENPDITLLMSDEAHFHLNGAVNKQNCRYWAQNNPKELHQQPLHSDKVTVWAAVAKFGVIGPYFFEEGGRAVTVNSERYQIMLREYLVPELRRRRLSRCQVYFQQDGATCHTSNESIAEVRRLFPGKVISKRGDVDWPPCSPDLTPCDYFLWGYLKNKVYMEKPSTLNELKGAIKREICSIPRNMLEKVMANFAHRVDECIENEGRHLTNVVFHK